MMQTTELETLQEQAKQHKHWMRFHKARLRLTMDKITEIKELLEAAGITKGEAKGE